MQEKQKNKKPDGIDKAYNETTMYLVLNKIDTVAPHAIISATLYCSTSILSNLLLQFLNQSSWFWNLSYFPIYVTLQKLILQQYIFQDFAYFFPSPSKYYLSSI